MVETVPSDGGAITCRKGVKKWKKSVPWLVNSVYEVWLVDLRWHAQKYSKYIPDQEEQTRPSKNLRKSCVIMGDNVKVPSIMLFVPLPVDCFPTCAELNWGNNRRTIPKRPFSMQHSSQEPRVVDEEAFVEMVGIREEYLRRSLGARYGVEARRPLAAICRTWRKTRDDFLGALYTATGGYALSIVSAVCSHKIASVLEWPQRKRYTRLIRTVFLVDRLCGKCHRSVNTVSTTFSSTVPFATQI